LHELGVQVRTDLARGSRVADEIQIREVTTDLFCMPLSVQGSASEVARDVGLVVCPSQHPDVSPEVALA